MIGLVAAGVAAGTAGLGLCLAAVRRGWRVRALPVAAAGMLAAVAFMMMPPVGSTDHLNYASYGRMAATGHDPYETSAADLPHDPVAGAPEEWRTTPSVYGPIATGEQALAAWIGGGSVRLTVFVLSVANTLAFAATALILYRTARERGAAAPHGAAVDVQPARAVPPRSPARTTTSSRSRRWWRRSRCSAGTPAPDGGSPACPARSPRASWPASAPR